MFKSLYIESREIEAPIDKITKVYVMKVKRSPCSVPLGIDLLGFRRSPDILAPLHSIKHHVGISRHGWDAKRTQKCHYMLEKGSQRDLESSLPLVSKSQKFETIKIAGTVTFNSSRMLFELWH